MSKEKGLEFESDAYYYDEPILKIFKIHPNAVRVVKAERTLMGLANTSALTYCMPYGLCNQLGWWIFPSISMDITCHSQEVENCFKGRWGDYFSYSVESYDSSDLDIMKEFEDKVSNPYGIKFSGKSHLNLGEPARNCFSMWTGLVLQCPRDWALLIQSPLNTGLIYDRGEPACVQSGIIESSWLRYDSWINFSFHTLDKTLSFRRDQTWPIAMIVPIHRSTYETNWQTIEKIMDPDDEDCRNIYERYCEYNFTKWVKTGEKDPMTQRKFRKSELLKHPTKSLFEKENPV